MQNSASSAAHAQAFALLALPIRLNNDDWIKIRRPAHPDWRIFLFRFVIYNAEVNNFGSSFRRYVYFDMAVRMHMEKEKI